MSARRNIFCFIMVFLLAFSVIRLVPVEVGGSSLSENPLTLKSMLETMSSTDLNLDFAYIIDDGISDNFEELERIFSTPLPSEFFSAVGQFFSRIGVFITTIIDITLVPIRLIYETLSEIFAILVMMFSFIGIDFV